MKGPIYKAESAADVPAEAIAAWNQRSPTNAVGAEGVVLPPFADAWAKYEAKGYRYGGDALENVDFGYRIAGEELAALRAQPVEHDALAGDLVACREDDGSARLHGQMVDRILAALSRQPVEAEGWRASVLNDIAEMMGEFVDNWPAHKKISTSLALIAKTMRAALDPPKHRYWMPGEPDCPREIKASNGELHTLRCKVCGQDDPRDERCSTTAQAGSEDEVS